MIGARLVVLLRKRLLDLFLAGPGVTAVGPPYYVDEAEVFATGGAAAELFSTGRAAGEVFVAGAAAGEIDGRAD